MKRDFYSEITSKIVAQLEAGTLPWVKGWSTGGRSLPMNAITNRPYSGINVLLYWTSADRGWSRPRFLTFKQAKAAGGYVRKGEKGLQLYFFKQIEVADEHGPEAVKRIPLLREYTVFNVEQCDGLPDHVVNGAEVVATNADSRETLADAFIIATGADLREGKGAPCYIPSRDFITVPSFTAFHDAPEFYAAAFHELAHWTGHTSRLDRDLKGRFGTDQYAMEELVAELTAAFLCAEFGLDNAHANQAAYLAGWIKVLKADSRAILTVASKAQGAANYLRDAANAAPVESIITKIAA
jgi:antirestriction protein ArdC